MSRGFASTFLNQRIGYSLWAHEDLKLMVNSSPSEPIMNWFEPPSYRISRDTTWEVCITPFRMDLTWLGEHPPINQRERSNRGWCHVNHLFKLFFLVRSGCWIRYSRVKFEASFGLTDTRSLVIKGTESNLVVFSANKAKDWDTLETYWAGFRVHTGGSLTASYTMIARAYGLSNTTSKRAQKHVVVLEKGSKADLDNVPWYCF